MLWRQRGSAGPNRRCWTQTSSWQSLTWRLRSMTAACCSGHAPWCLALRVQHSIELPLPGQVLRALTAGNACEDLLSLHAGDPEVVVQDAAATNANGNGRQPQQRLSAGWSTEEFAADLGPSNATTSIDAEEDSGQKPVLLVFNKLDLAFDQPRQVRCLAATVTSYTRLSTCLDTKLWQTADTVASLRGEWGRWC